MPERISKGEIKTGTRVYEWTVTEYEQHERPLRWYVLVAILGIALLAYSILTANYLFALIIVLFGVILFLHDVQAPIEIPFALTDLGIVIGDKFYRYSEIKNFWMIYNPPEVKNLYFSTSSVLKHRVQIPLFDNDPRPIRLHLARYLTEDLNQEEEPMSDRIARLLKI